MTYILHIFKTSIMSDLYTSVNHGSQFGEMENTNIATDIIDNLKFCAWKLRVAEIVMSIIGIDIDDLPDIDLRMAHINKISAEQIALKMTNDFFVRISEINKIDKSFAEEIIFNVMYDMFVQITNAANKESMSAEEIVLKMIRQIIVQATPIVKTIDTMSAHANIALKMRYLDFYKN